MATVFMLAVDGSGTADLIVGSLLGVCIGLLVGPALRSRLACREWTEASREARLADRLLHRLEVDADLDSLAHRVDDDPHSGDANGRAGRPTWRTSR